MKISMIGLGMGDAASLTAAARATLLDADCIIGAPRLIAALPEGCTANRQALIRAEVIAEFIENHPEYDHVALAFSGDTGFYSGAKRLKELLAGYAIEILPGLSSVQVMAARLGRPWQDLHLVSAHAEGCDPVAHVMNHAACFFLTGSSGPAALCGALHAAGMDHITVTVGENLGAPNERITTGTPADLMDGDYASLSVLIADNPSPLPPAPTTQGLPDGAFIRGDVPMTKQAVRAVALAKLGLAPHETLYDIGAGTGSVAVEMALQARWGRVYAIEQKPEACDLIRRNRRKFGVYNLTCIEGRAPAAMAGLPAPDAAFIGGTTGGMADILSALVGMNPHVRVAVTAIALETLNEALACLSAAPFTGLEVLSLTAAESRAVGPYHMMAGQNPIYILSAHAAPEGETL